MVLLALAPALGACGNTDLSAEPAALMHRLEGGAIAQQRPPPPGAGQPFPNLGSIPPRPVPLPPTARQQVADALSIDRTLAEREAALAPLPPPSAPAAPNLPPPAPPDANASTATMAASSPAPPAAPGGAPAAAPTRPSATPTPAITPLPTTVNAGPPPALPAAPPAPAAIPGFAVPTEPPPLAIAFGPAPAAAPLPSPAPGLVIISFTQGSSVLPRDAFLPLRALAAQRHGRAIDVTGRGEAPSSRPALQAAALQFALDRAQAIAAALSADGVPANAIRLQAEAAGRGGWARLVD